VSAATDHLDSMVESGQLTRDEADALVASALEKTAARVPPHLVQAVEAKFPQMKGVSRSSLAEIGEMIGASPPEKGLMGFLSGRDPLEAAGIVAGLGGALTAGGVVAGPAAQAGVHAVDTAVQEAMKRHRFNKMVEAHPELADDGQYDNTMVQRAWNTMHRFAPEMAADPLVAGTFVKRVSDAELIDHKTVSELIKARKDMSRPLGQQAAGGAGMAFGGAVKAVTG